MIVVDVSLIAYLLLGGPDTVLVQRVAKRDPVWAAPLLWRTEFRSVLASFIRHRGLSTEDAWRTHEFAERLMADHEFTVAGDSVLRLIADSNCSAYDCEYVALAQELSVPLVTADKELQRVFKGLAVSPKEFVTRA